MNDLLDSNCTFCQIIIGDLPSTKVYEDSFVLAFNDIAIDSSKHLNHILIVPKIHVQDLMSNRSNLAKFYIDRVLEAILLVADLMSMTHFQVLINNGKNAGQVVYHLHIHLMQPLDH